jgi:hypothetical protein
MPRLRICGAIPPFPHMFSWYGASGDTALMSANAGLG